MHVHYVVDLPYRTNVEAKRVFQERCAMRCLNGRGFVQRFISYSVYK